jgi:hypothetical protein
MHAAQYRKIAEHPLRQIFRNMVTDSRDLPSRTELRESIDAALPGADQKVRDALFSKAIELAQTAAQDRGAWFDLRGSADQLVLQVVESMEAAERILPVQEPEVDAAEVANQATALSWGEQALQAIESRLPDSAGNV